MAKRKPWLGGWSREERALLKKADRRLRELERTDTAARTREQLRGFAYKMLQKDLERLGLIGTGDRPRVDRKRPENANKARALLNRVRAFMEAPSATITGYKELQKQNLDKFNKKLKLTGDDKVTAAELEELADVFEIASYGSGTISAVIAAVKTRDVDTLQALGMIRTAKVSVDDLGVARGQISTTGDKLLTQIAGALGEDPVKWKEWTTK